MKETIFKCDICKSSKMFGEITEQKIQCVEVPNSANIIAGDKKRLVIETVDICEKCLQKIINGQMLYTSNCVRWTDGKRYPEQDRVSKSGKDYGDFAFSIKELRLTGVDENGEMIPKNTTETKENRL